MEVQARLEEEEELGQNLIDGLWQLFEKTDVDGKGTVGAVEFQQMINDHWRSSSQIRNLSLDEVKKEIADAVNVSLSSSVK